MRDFLTPPGYEGARWSARKLLNVYLSRWEEGRGRTKLRSYPFKLTVEATGACNLRCPACFTGVGDVGRPGSPMPLDLYRPVLAELRDYPFDLESINSGGPLLPKNIYTMIPKASARRVPRPRHRD